MRKMLLCAALLCSCSGLPSKRVPRQASEPVEFRAVLCQGDDRWPVEVSTKKKRFRLERDGKILVGDLGRGEVDVMNPQSKTYFRTDIARFSKLFETHDRPAATRYEGAANQTDAHISRDVILFPFQSACEAASVHTTHQECQSGTPKGDLVTWRHTNHSRTSLQAGLKKVVTETSHTDNTRIGVLVKGPKNQSYFDDPQVLELSEDRFEVPDDYKEILSDEELRDPRFGYLAPPEAFPESDWFGFMEFIRDIPAPPDHPDWTYQQEKWQEKSGEGPARNIVWIERLYSHKPTDFAELPVTVHHGFSSVQTWDDKAEVGSRSFREGPGSLVFAAHGQLFRVKVLDESMADQIPDLAKALVERARRDR